MQYIFEGLAHLAARILIMASNSMESIDQMSVQRMCRNALALQQTLSSITATREVALDNARNFYEMLYMEPEVSHHISAHSVYFVYWTVICFLFLGNFNKHHWERRSIHWNAISKCSSNVVQKQRHQWFKCIGHISTETLWYSWYKTNSRCNCLKKDVYLTHKKLYYYSSSLTRSI